jgi:hypothetical protein
MKFLAAKYEPKASANFTETGTESKPPRHSKGGSSAERGEGDSS